MSERSYNVIALEFPIVYTIDGDHDPNGMLFTLAAHKPLLAWARRQWEAHDQLLPTLHRQQQLMQLVVDGLDRYQRMRVKISAGNVADHGLLHELGGEDELLGREQRDVDGPQLEPRARAVRQNYRATVDDLVLALTELTRGRVKTLSGDAAVLDVWRRDWSSALLNVTAAITTQLHYVDEDFRNELPCLLRDSNLPEERIKRELFNDHSFDVSGQAEQTPPYDRYNPLKPLALARPLVLRALAGERVVVHLENQVRQRSVGMHLQGEQLGGQHQGGQSGVGVNFGDGAHVGRNHNTTVASGGRGIYTWSQVQEGVWPINDLADIRGTERGTNVHGLFAALVVEPEGCEWHDPETGEDLTGKPYADGLSVDIIYPNEKEFDESDTGTGNNPCTDGCSDQDPCRDKHRNFVDFHLDKVNRSFREFTIFFHDEPEIHSGLHLSGEHSVMPISYRAEPMTNRLPHRMRRYAYATPPQVPGQQRKIDHSAVTYELDDELNEVFWVARHPDGHFLERVAGEEQHHSSWLFGEPVTQVLKAYRGDPARIRLVHAGVKETHVFHLHVHQWRAVPQDTAPPSVWRNGEPRGSQLLDSITIGPQTGVTIDPLYGSGSRQRALGDIIWHCHLYPHFHHGMWGLWRSYDRLVDGSIPAYPDGTPCHPLKALPGRTPPKSTTRQPGFPWFIDATFPRKSPPPPALLEEHLGGRRRLLDMPKYSQKELDAFDPGCKNRPRPGALFVDLDGDALKWNNAAGLPQQRLIRYDVEVAAARVDYNRAGWHDARGHYYQITGVQVSLIDADGSLKPSTQSTPNPLSPLPPAAGIETFFPRANHGDVVELRFHNMLGSFPADDFDLAVLPVECGLHVHLVKFDVLAADGSSTGWNYLSGASTREAVGANVLGQPDRHTSFHRWVVDEEFGPCFFHDHLLANYRQKHGLFAALIAEPQGAEWLLPDQQTIAWAGPEAVVRPPAESGLPPYREACLAVGDFIPLYRAEGDPLNTPRELGGDDDPGAMGVNFRSAPLTHRGDDPSQWFSSSWNSPALPDRTDADAAAAALRREDRVGQPTGPRQIDSGDPDTPVIETYPGERIRIRLIQGSHEEQHSFVTHGLRWRKEWHDLVNAGGQPPRRAPLVNQQTLGISEAFTLDLDPQDGSSYGPGDYLWQFAAMDDLWLGCWGLIRANTPSAESFKRLRPLAHLAGGQGLVPGKPPAISMPRRAPLGDEQPDNKRWVTLGEDGTWTEATVRHYVVVARRIEHFYDGQALTDPWGLIYEVADSYEEETVPAGPSEDEKCDLRDEASLEAAKPAPTTEPLKTGNRRARGIHRTLEPLVLRARRGEWIHVTLINEVLLPEEGDEKEQEANRANPDPHHVPLNLADPLLPRFGVEVSPPRLPIEHTDEFGYPDRRKVSPRVSLHPSLLQYDVVSDDGANVGRNHDSTTGSLDVDRNSHGAHEAGSTVVFREDHGAGHRDRNWCEYWWYADEELAPASHTSGPGQVCYLQDMGDVRNHRHHGLIGAIVVEPGDCTPVRLDPTTGQDFQDQSHHTVWWGANARIEDGQGQPVAQEMVLFLQDGLRHFVAGDIDLPLRDVMPGDDPEDSGQKGISYRSALVNNKNVLRTERPATPLYEAQLDDSIWLRLVCAADKPRNHTFTLHGQAWSVAPWLPRTDGQPASPSAGSISGLTAATTHDLVILATETGDHAYRSGVFKWAVSQGMWGILRVHP